ncbi:MAG: nucleotide exchange factor GrpE [Clostridiales bacterium]|nr:nucleotide exchange factor GrpE [Clostridiales bacterium]
MAKKVKKAEDIETAESKPLPEEQFLPEEEMDEESSWQEVVYAIKELQRQKEECEQKCQRLQESEQKMQRQKEESEQKSQRLLADFDNFRRRSKQEKEDTVRFANSELLSALLPVADNLERAVAFAQKKEENYQALREGVEMILKQLLSAFAAAGVERIEAEGADFDPQHHEAFAQEETGEEQKGKVLLEIRKGYLLNGRLLRASMVKVGC